MKLEAVVICKDYADFLEHTLPHNMQVFDRMVVVTHPSDNRTKTLCAKFGIDCIETEEFHRDGDKFNKGRAINLGLSHLRHNGSWILHMDADIVLPHRFRKMLDYAELNEKNIYGADRMNTDSYDNWMKHKDKAVPAHSWRYMVGAPKEFNLGARLLHQEYGYCPIGYFQLWHSSANRKYPIVNGSAEHGDVLFAVQWPRANRVLLPEVFCYHLESDGNAMMGANWNGRKTPPFGPGTTIKKHEPPREHAPKEPPCKPEPRPEPPCQPEPGPYRPHQENWCEKELHEVEAWLKKELNRFL